jgi:hypothetical protein
MVSSILGLGSSSYAGKTSMDGVLLDLIRTSFLRSGRLKFYDCVWKSCKPQHSKTHRLRCQLGLGYQRRGYLSTVITYRLSSRSEARLRPFSSGRTRIHERGLNWWCEWPGAGRVIGFIWKRGQDHGQEKTEPGQKWPVFFAEASSVNGNISD